MGKTVKENEVRKDIPKATGKFLKEKKALEKRVIKKEIEKGLDEYENGD